MANLRLVVGVVVLALSLLVVTPGLRTLTEATPPGPFQMGIFILNVIVFQREEEVVGQVGVAREEAEITIRVVGAEEADIGTGGMMIRVRRSPG